MINHIRSSLNIIGVLAAVAKTGDLFQGQTIDEYRLLGSINVSIHLYPFFNSSTNDGSFSPFINVSPDHVFVGEILNLPSISE